MGAVILRGHAHESLLAIASFLFLFLAVCCSVLVRPAAREDDRRNSDNSIAHSRRAYVEIACPIRPNVQRIGPGGHAESA